MQQMLREGEFIFLKTGVTDPSLTYTATASRPGTDGRMQLVHLYNTVYYCITIIIIIIIIITAAASVLIYTERCM